MRKRYAVLLLGAVLAAEGCSAWQRITETERERALREQREMLEGFGKTKRHRPRTVSGPEQDRIYQEGARRRAAAKAERERQEREQREAEARKQREMAAREAAEAKAQAEEAARTGADLAQEACRLIGDIEQADKEIRRERAIGREGGFVDASIIRNASARKVDAKALLREIDAEYIERHGRPRSRDWSCK